MDTTIKKQAQFLLERHTTLKITEERL